jgi:hypothetical protein
VALVAAFFFGVTRLTLKLSPSLLLRLNLNKTSALVAIVPVIFYTFIAGLGVAAVRSTIMALSSFLLPCFWTGSLPQSYLVFIRKSRLPLPLDGRRCEKFGICPLTLPSPARGEGKHIDI